MADINNRGDRATSSTHSSTPVWLIGAIIIVALVIAAFAFGLIDIDQTKTTKLPDVKVEASGGQAPAFDVNTATVDVGTEKKTIEVPTMSVEKAKDSK